jgi:hypothetical protein
MTEQLGKIEKPDVEQFTGKRKLFLVPLVFVGDSAPIEYVVQYDLYWEQVAEHLNNLEAKVGRINHIFHELLDIGGEESVKMVEKLNPACGKIVREKFLNGSAMEATEDRLLTEESMDWERCLYIGFISQKVAGIVYDFYSEAQKKRYEFIAKRINEVIKDSESAVLFIREGHSVQFPNDIEVFSVAPPALDALHRLQREAAKKETEAEKTGSEKKAAKE